MLGSRAGLCQAAGGLGGEAADGGVDDFGEELGAGAAALGEVGASAAAAFEGEAGFAHEGVHVAGGVGRAGEDEAGARFVARAEQGHDAGVRGERGGEAAE